MRLYVCLNNPENMSDKVQCSNMNIARILYSRFKKLIDHYKVDYQESVFTTTFMLEFGGTGSVIPEGVYQALVDEFDFCKNNIKFIIKKAVVQPPNSVDDTSTEISIPTNTICSDGSQFNILLIPHTKKEYQYRKLYGSIGIDYNWKLDEYRAVITDRMRFRFGRVDIENEEYKKIIELIVKITGSFTAPNDLDGVTVKVFTDFTFSNICMMFCHLPGKLEQEQILHKVYSKLLDAPPDVLTNSLVFMDLYLVDLIASEDRLVKRWTSSKISPYKGRGN